MPSKIILDTNFIIICMKEGLDFFHELKLMGFHILIPLQVIQELEKLKRKKELKLLEIHKESFKTIRFKKGYVDKGMVEFSKKNPKAVVATLDSALRNKITNPIMVIRGKKTLEVV